jgi:hypothetical protein
VQLSAWTEDRIELRTCDFPVPVAPRTTSNGCFGDFIAMATYFRALLTYLSIRASDFRVVVAAGSPVNSSIPKWQNEGGVAGEILLDVWAWGVLAQGEECDLQQNGKLMG